MTPSPRSETRSLMNLVALTDFLIRSGQQGPAIAATERLSDALLAHYRALPDRFPGARNNTLGRDTLRLRAEVRLLTRRLRSGPVRLVPSLRSGVEALLLDEVLAVEPAAG